MVVRLVPCVSCARHIKVSDGACPFCGAGVVDPGTPGAISNPLSRAAVLFVGMTTAAACTGGPETGGSPSPISSTSSSSGSESSSSTSGAPDPTAVPVYGPAPTPTHTATALPMYGPAVIPDAGSTDN
jgi:hypothetical protein